MTYQYTGFQMGKSNAVAPLLYLNRRKSWALPVFDVIKIAAKKKGS